MRKLQQAARKLRHSVQFVISVGRTRIQTTTNKKYGNEEAEHREKQKNVISE